MRTRLAAIAAVLVSGAALAALLWLAVFLLAPPLFAFLWRGPRSAWAPVVLATLAPVLVGLPFGFAFGMLPWRRTVPLALAASLLAAAVDLALVLRSGIDLLGPRGWIYPVEEVVLVALFTAAALAGTRAMSHQTASRRLLAGGAALCLLAAATCGAAYWSWQTIASRSVQ